MLYSQIIRLLGSNGLQPIAFHLVDILADIVPLFLQLAAIVIPPLTKGVGGDKSKILCEADPKFDILIQRVVKEVFDIAVPKFLLLNLSILIASHTLKKRCGKLE
ncbi:hypothetical protein CO669_17585 [Bradyrhizobium sp. Y36]|nr:hypothetical protein CO669_17585 [Bradyrhizobium sp. Y36]